MELEKNTLLKKNKYTLERKEALVAVTFIAPFMTGFLIFVITPTLYAFVISLLDYNAMKELSSVKWLGFDNYIRILRDPIAIGAYGRSALYALFFVPATLVVSYLTALLLNRSFWLRGLARSFILLPYVANMVAVALIFSILLNPFGGPVNTILMSMGIEKPPLWLGGIQSALPTVAMINAWQGFAFQTIVFLAALQMVSADLYEAAEIDGARRWQKSWYITLPLISPTTFFLIITGIIHSFQNYALIRTLTNGGPGTSTRVISLNIYEEAFTYNHYSYASAQAILLFVFLLIITIVQWKGQKKWVHD